MEALIGLSYVVTWASEVELIYIFFPWMYVTLNIVSGGTTPSMGLLKAVQKAVPNIPIMVRDSLSLSLPLIDAPGCLLFDLMWMNLQVMVRPRCGDFVYTSSELDVMIEDIRNFRELGVAGVVFGVLTCGGRVDTERTKRFVDTL